MADNNNAAKTCCITLVLAILMENRFRGQYNNFVPKLHESQLSVEELYVVQPDQNSTGYVLKVVFSYAIWLFYLALSVMVGLAYCYVL